jgi:hypothetical protein
MYVPPPDDLDQSAPVEPLKIGLLGKEEQTLKGFLTELVDSHSTKLTKDQKYTLRDNYRLILLNLLYNGSEGVYTAISRSSGAFSGDTYWDSIGLTYRASRSAVDRLSDEGYLTVYPGFVKPSGFGRLTRLYPTEKLFERIPLADSSLILDWTDTLILKGFADTRGVQLIARIQKRRLDPVNTFLKGFNWRLKSPIKLICNEHYHSGGRLYTRFQNLPKAQRAVLTINNQPTVELDYKANHPRMLMAMSKITPSHDPYTDIAKDVGVTRGQAKAFITCSLGAGNKEKSFAACKRYKINKPLFNRLQASTKKLFPIGFLYKGFGNFLQSTEGQIALDVMYAGVKKGIPVLPVHDSFITLTEHEDWLRKEMTKQWKKHLQGYLPVIEVSHRN